MLSDKMTINLNVLGPLIKNNLMMQEILVSRTSKLELLKTCKKETIEEYQCVAILSSSDA